MKFDCLLTNPPYQDSSHSEKKNTLWRKWIKFNDQLVKDNGVFSLVIPSSWMGSSPVLKENFLLKTKNNILENKISFGTFEKVNIQNQYNLKKIILPFYDEKNIYNNKKIGFIEIFQNKVIIAFGKSKILLFDKDSFEKEKFNNLKEIRSNLICFSYSILLRSIK